MITTIDAEKLYASSLDKWCKEGASEVEEGLSNFIEKIQINFNTYLTYDNRLCQAAIKLMNNFDYIEYNQKQQHRNQLKSRLRKIIRVLYIDNFLTIDDYHKLTNALSTCYLSKEFDRFLEMVTFQQRQLSEHEIETFWKNSVKRNFEYTWSFFSKNNIFDDKIIKVFEISQPIIKKCSLQKIQEFNQYNDKNKRIQFSKILRLKDVNLASVQLKNEFNIKLDKLISQKCLFLNKIMLDKAILQIKKVVQIILEKDYEDNITYDIYGSLRTGFALIFHSDADITINYTNQQSSRERKILKLQQIYHNLRKEEQTLDYFKIQLLASPRIRNPLVKINFDTKRQYRNRSPLCSVDILIDSPIGVQNSKILELYSKSICIIKLVCLVKFWGKRKNIISPKRFSSYGITLMVLYFLIKTNQAPYIIKTSQSYRLQKALISQNQFNPLLENFVAFLDFYKLKGYFYTQKKPVCLMQMNGLETDDNILINMYDFIDGSNPGRVSKIMEQKFYTTINKTIQKLRLSVDLSDIMEFEE